MFQHVLSHLKCTEAIRSHKILKKNLKNLKNLEKNPKNLKNLKKNLIRFKSSKEDGYTSLKNYVKRMQKDQKIIYYIIINGSITWTKYRRFK